MFQFHCAGIKYLIQNFSSSSSLITSHSIGSGLLEKRNIEKMQEMVSPGPGSRNIGLEIPDFKELCDFIRFKLLGSGLFCNPTFSTSLHRSHEGFRFKTQVTQSDSQVLSNGDKPCLLEKFGPKSFADLSLSSSSSK